MSKRLITFAAFLLAVVMAGCSAPSEQNPAGSTEGSGGTQAPVKIVATNNGWDSQMLHNAIAEIVVEHAYDGYAFEVSTASSAMNWQSILAGEVDLDIESWTENVASYSEDLANGDVAELGVLVPDSAQGLYVPRYVVEGDPDRGIEPMAPGLKTVEDLKNYPDVFPDDEEPGRGRIYGSIPGWMADEVLYNKYIYYGLDESYNYTRLGSDAVLFSSLVSAYNQGDAWVGYCFEPTWVTGKLDLILLEDAPYDKAVFMDGQCAFPSQELKTVSNSRFAEKAPDLIEFFQNYRTGSALISSALAHLDETGATHEETAIWLLKEHDELIDQWLPAGNAQKLRDYLSNV